MSTAYLHSFYKPYLERQMKPSTKIRMALLYSDGDERRKWLINELASILKNPSTESAYNPCSSNDHPNQNTSQQPQETQETTD